MAEIFIPTLNELFLEAERGDLVLLFSDNNQQKL
jgi:hypothetical protein